MEGLAAAVDDTAAHQFHYAIGEHLAMDAEVFFVGEGLQDGVGDGADAQLQGGAVGHKRGTMLSDGKFHVAWRR